MPDGAAPRPAPADREQLGSHESSERPRDERTYRLLVLLSPSSSLCKPTMRCRCAHAVHRHRVQDGASQIRKGGATCLSPGEPGPQYVHHSSRLSHCQDARGLCLQRHPASAKRRRRGRRGQCHDAAVPRGRRREWNARRSRSRSAGTPTHGSGCRRRCHHHGGDRGRRCGRRPFQ